MLTPAEARKLAEGLLRDAPGELREDDFGNLVFAMRFDITHLDADALHDRLVAWVRRDVAPGLREAHAEVSFHHAHPETDDADPDFEAPWRDVEAWFVLDTARPLPAQKVEAWAALVPAFVERVGAAGRPKGFRDPHHGAAE